MKKDERLAAAKAWHKAQVQALADAVKASAKAEETIATVANLFSNSVWKLLPQSIKAYFEAYRK
jgi:hypothetical protein